MRTPLLAALCGILLATPAFAQSEVEAGAAEFGKCIACHAITAPDGVQIVKGGKLGPNLFGIIGQPVAAVSDYTLYGDGIKAVAATGATWTRPELTAYLADPVAWVTSRSGDKAAKSKMTWKQPSKQAELIAYISALGGK
jgi:cytochrome c